VLPAAEAQRLVRILHQAIEVGALTPQRVGQPRERRVDLSIDLKPIVVAEVARRVAHQVGLARGGVGVRVAVLHEKPEADARGQQDFEALPQETRVGREGIRRLRRARDQPEQVELERGEEHLGRHEAIRDPRDVADVVQRLGH